jgi:membrane protein YqaA with SNARE-associated domain
MRAMRFGGMMLFSGSFGLEQRCKLHRGENITGPYTVCLAAFFLQFLSLLVRLGYFGPFLLGVLDSSFLFLPFGNDLLVVGLVARHHEGYLLYVLSAVCGSSCGTFLLDLVARKAGEAGVQKIAGRSRFEYLKRKIGEKGGRAIVVGCLAPPPFPFTMVVATTSALGYPRKKLLTTVAAARAVRFLILGYLAIRFGRQILRIASSQTFRWMMIVFVILCVVGSALSIAKWVRKK